MAGWFAERMARSGVDLVSVDWTVDMKEGDRYNIGVQGNLDPCALFGPKEFIRERILDTVRKAKQGHILNLGHGVLPSTQRKM